MEKEVRVSKLLFRLCLKVWITAVFITTAIGSYIIISSDGAVFSIRTEAFIITLGIVVSPMLVAAYISHRINKVLFGVALKYERQVFYKKEEKKQLAKEYAEVYVPLKLSGGDLRVWAATKIKVVAVLIVGNRKLQLSAPEGKHTKQELMKALLTEKKLIETQLRELAFPKKPAEYRRWERFFGLDQVQAA